MGYDYMIYVAYIRHTILQLLLHSMTADYPLINDKISSTNNFETKSE